MSGALAGDLAGAAAIAALVSLIVHAVRRGRPPQPRRSARQIAAPRPRTMTGWASSVNRSIRRRGRPGR
jgi:hypothetical protein